ncbi:MAG: UvrD-helicase domain-containing protein [Pirellulales bacterium]
MHTTINGTSFNETETDEKNYLKYMKVKIAAELDAVDRKVNSRHTEMLDLKDYLQENKADLDHVEKAAVRQSVDIMSRIGEHAVTQKKRLLKLLHSPYFGRIDVRIVDRTAVSPTYIGVHSLYDAETETQLIHDWRAPISSMFYEFELGDAFYEAPEGRTNCKLLRKRQYRIENQELAFMLETSLNIQDDILQKELSQASDDKMKNIVATIQRDQNAIIRNDQAHTLIIQGAAGSGKTSIALHRIAFLLFKYKDILRSEDILIISPNKVFAHYISQVLPELGEEMIQEMTMEGLAAELLGKVKYQTFSEQVSTLLCGRDDKYAERVKFKASEAFLSKLEQYGHQTCRTHIDASGVQVGLFSLDSEWIDARFRRSTGGSASEQVSAVLNAIEEHMQSQHRKEIESAERKRLRSELRRMVTTTTLKALYKNFFTWLGEPDMFKPAKGGKYEYADVFPLIYLKMMTEDTLDWGHIKHVVIDEMQDYTPVQYEVIAGLFECKKTILGDYNQSVSPLSSSTAESIQAILRQAECMYMNKSYRSTLQITEIAQSIHRNPSLVPIERHGEMPVVIACGSTRQEIDQILLEIDCFQQSDFNSLGIICKTQDQADSLFESLRAGCEYIRLLDADSTIFGDGIMIATAYLAKGLEFDHVIVPFCNDKQYNAVIDRHMLYVACTRAMHRLTLTHTGGISQFLRDATENSLVVQTR